MDMNYLVQRKINAQKQYRRKVTLTIALSAILVLLIVVGLVKVILDDKKAEEAKQANGTNIAENVNPGTNAGIQDADSAANGEGTTAENNSSGENNADQGQNGESGVVSTPVPTEAVIPTETPMPTVVKKKIAVDPGHGGEDLGSTRQGLYEKNANLAIALFLKKELEEAGYEVFMIRETDVDVANDTRPVAAVEQKADLYISVHLNSLDADSDATQGAEAWYADLRNDGSDVLAQTVIDELTKVIDTRNRGIKLSNRLIVLKNPDMPPACLVECGFITSETERAKLFVPEYQKKIAEGICNGIKKFLPVE